MLATLDAPGTRCAFNSRGCTGLAQGCGGFDQHHRWPVELGGDPNQPLLTLCAIHHRRQHSLIRYLVERDHTNEFPTHAVTGRFTRLELEAANYAVAQWIGVGRPPINGWPCPAARPSENPR